MMDIDQAAAKTAALELMAVEAFQRYADEHQAIMDRLGKKYPHLPVTTIMVMAGDYLNLPKVDEAYLNGEMNFHSAAHWIGSYARFGWAVEKLNQEEVDPAVFFHELCELWRSSDPDDTLPEFLAVFRKAYLANHNRMIRDGRPLRRYGFLTVYRGEPILMGELPTQNPEGFSWTLDRAIAKKFATGAGVRHPVKHGVVWKGQAHSQDVLAYITGRNEAEVIIPATQVRRLTYREVRKDWDVYLGKDD